MLPRFKYHLIWAASLAAMATALAPRATDWVIYNHSPSMPIGLYWRLEAERDARPSKGQIVTVRAHDVAPQMAAARHFDGPANRFIKHVAGLPGDRVCAQNDAITINGAAPIIRRSTLFVDAKTSASVPIWSGCRVLHADEVLLLGETADSFDGRYWGPVPIKLIEGVWLKI